MAQTIVQVDAFTDAAFSGNPAAVCVMAEPRDDSWMQSVAREMNLSETAFTHWDEQGYRLRWFTPAVEVDLCGHATLATAHVLWEDGYVKASDHIEFNTRSGLLTASLDDQWIDLNFPLDPARPIQDPPPNLADGLGVRPKFVGKNSADYLVEVESESVLRGLRPDFGLLRTLPARGVMVTSHSASDQFDFVSRFFAPQSGVDEDPVTGSAHCCLGPFWGERLKKTELTAYQASARGGVVRVRLQPPRVILRGQAVTVMRGRLLP